MAFEKQKSNIENLLKLVKENPNLEIVPMVDHEVCGGDDFGSWMGSWGKSSVDEVYHHDERIYFRSEDEEELIEKQGDYIFDNEYPNHTQLSENESEKVIKKATEHVNELSWEKVIVVDIDTP